MQVIHLSRIPKASPPNFPKLTFLLGTMAVLTFIIDPWLLMMMIPFQFSSSVELEQARYGLYNSGQGYLNCKILKDIPPWVEQKVNNLNIPKQRNTIFMALLVTFDSS